MAIRMTRGSRTELARTQRKRYHTDVHQCIASMPFGPGLFLKDGKRS
jgi:hypothetical protein